MGRSREQGLSHESSPITEHSQTIAGDFKRHSSEIPHSGYSGYSGSPFNHILFSSMNMVLGLYRELLFNCEVWSVFYYLVVVLFCYAKKE